MVHFSIQSYSYEINLKRKWKWDINKKKKIELKFWLSFKPWINLNVELFMAIIQ